MGLFDFFKKKKENDEEIALDKALNIKEINESEDEIAITNESSEISIQNEDNRFNYNFVLLIMLKSIIILKSFLQKN